MRVYRLCSRYAYTFFSSSRFWRDGAATQPRGALVCCRQADLGRHCARAEGESPECQSMVSRLAAWWCWCPAGCGAGGSQTQAQCETTPANCEGAAARRSGPWLHDGFMDITSGGHGDRAIDRRALSPRTCVEDSGGHRLEPTTTDQAGSSLWPPESSTHVRGDN